MKTSRAVTVIEAKIHGLEVQKAKAESELRAATLAIEGLRAILKEIETAKARRAKPTSKAAAGVRAAFAQAAEEARKAAAMKERIEVTRTAGV